MEISDTDIYSSDDNASNFKSIDNSNDNPISKDYIDTDKALLKRMLKR